MECDLNLLLGFLCENENTTDLQNRIALAFAQLTANINNPLQSIKELAIERGFIARDLKGLKLVGIGPFIEEKGTLYKKVSTQSRSREMEETAYFCRNCNFWVIGEPNKKKYELNGEPGIRYKCKICDSCIGDNHD